MTKVWVVVGEYSAYGDHWSVVAGVWATEAEANEHVRLMNELPGPKDEPWPGAWRPFWAYDFEVVESEIGKPDPRFDPAVASRSGE